MKATGIIRRIDDLGRIVIPKEIRERIFGTRNCEGKPMELFMDGDSIVLRKYEDAEMRKEKEIRDNAIDEFVERLKSDEFQKYNLDMVFETSRDLSYSHCINAFCEYIDEIAEQMKAGAE